MKEWAEGLRKRYNTMYGILRQDITRLSAPATPGAEGPDDPIGHGLAINSLNGAPVNLASSSFKNGLQLANGADRGKVTITFKYLGVGPVIVGSGVDVTYTADLAVAGVNGLDTGAEAGSTWYYVYIIVGEIAPEVNDTANALQPPMRRTGASVASLLSASATAPTLPPGFNRFRRVGAVRNNQTDNTATGGTITTDGDYTIHTFTASGTFTPAQAMDVEV